MGDHNGIITRSITRSLITISLLLSITSIAESSCKSDWTEYQGFCYKHFLNQFNWTKAHHVCLQNAGNLVSIHSSKEMIFLSDKIMQSTQTGQTWTGLCYTGNEYEWSDKSPLNYTNWGGSLQNQNNGNCATIVENAQYKWYLDVDSAWHSFICKTPSTNEIGTRGTQSQLYASMKNKLLLNHVFHIERVASLLQCSIVCMRYYSKCQSLSYGNGTCYLNSATAQDFPHNLVDEKSFIYAVSIK